MAHRRARSTILNVYQAINAVQADLSQVGIAKNRTNTQGAGFKFRGIDDVLNALSPLLAKHGLVIIPRVISRTCTERSSKSGGALFYVVIEAEFDFVSAEDGSKTTARMIGEAMDSGDKGMNKAYSIALKYALFQAFLIPTEELKDPDAETHNIDAILTCIVNIEAAASRDELLQIWRAYPSLQSNAKVKEAFTTAGTKFKQ